MTAPSTELLHAAYEEAPVGMSLVSAREGELGRILRVNRAVCRMLGYPENELLSLTVQEITHPDDMARDLESYRAVERGEADSYAIDKRFIRADGEVVWIQLYATLVRDENGAPLYLIGQAVDITPLRRAAARLSAVVDSALDAIVAVDAGGTILEFNPAAERLFGYTREQAVGASVDLIVPERERAALTRLLGGEDDSLLGRRIERYLLHAGGAELPVELALTCVDTDPPTFTGFIRDLRPARDAAHERTELEGRLQQAQRLDSLGRLTGGVAHDFNNLLAVIGGYADYLAGEVSDGPGAVEGIEEIRRAARRGAALTRQLLAVGRRDLADPVALDLRDAVTGLRRLLESSLGEHVDLEIRIPDHPCRAAIDVHQFEQILLNLALNARDAMSEGPGRLEIEVASGDGRVGVIVSDSGAGMEPEVAARAFDPFFTTKSPGQGTGLGLATVYGIVAQAGGEVGIESRVGEGTRVTIGLPEAPAPDWEPAAPPPAELRTARGETILLVEDEDGVRAMAARILRRHGYQVVEAAGAEEALTTFRGLERRPDLVLTDVAMPRMSGVEMAARLGKASPPVVFMSGYTDASVGSPDVLEHSAGFLQKPFSANALLQRVGDALAGSAGSPV